MIKAVLFDFGQTLVDSANGFRAAEKEAQARIFSDLSLTSWENFLSSYRRIRKEFHDKSMFSRKLIWEEVYFYYCLAPDLTRLEIWEHEYWETVKAHTTLFPETEQVLEALTARYKLALITNTQGQQARNTHRINQFSNLERFFKVIIVAGEGGVPPKPDRIPFRLCLERLGIVPDEAVYVGDDWRIDICGAKDVGIQPIWLQHYSVNRNWPAVETSLPIITSLDQLLDLERLVS
ncbi:MAG: HAD family hydrolase [Pseudomonadota bacterium]